ncbi:MAG: type II toxin-antitoxin system VapC family toxin, partial [Chloroflexi bacterium]|nr:type II toxin-antitoxin system VapC family toxin [Chloroflexota bacterium]
MAASVADASVLAALLFDEPRRAEAEELLADADLFEPTLLPYELASVARKKIRLDPEQEEPVLRALELLAEVPFRWVVVDQH